MSGDINSLNLSCLHLTSSNNQRLVSGMITSLHSKYMTSGYHHGMQIPVGGKELIAYTDFGLSREIVSKICDKFNSGALLYVSEKMGILP